ncbi:hypothetical protein K3495_g16417, partial [Podosphaera aphanis]
MVVKPSKRHGAATADTPRNVARKDTNMGTCEDLKIANKELKFGNQTSNITNAFNTGNIEEQDPVAFVTSIPESVTIEQALKDDKEGWINAIIKELKALETTRTFTLMTGTPPAGRKLITSKLVLRYKPAANTTEKIKKARVVARGFQQEAGLDYSETFASVIRYNTLRAVLGIAAVRDLEIDSVDIDTAFLNPLLKEEIYMQL